MLENGVKENCKGEHDNKYKQRSSKYPQFAIPAFQCPQLVHLLFEILLEPFDPQRESVTQDAAVVIVLHLHSHLKVQFLEHVSKEHLWKEDAIAQLLVSWH